MNADLRFSAFICGLNFTAVPVDCLALIVLAWFSLSGRLQHWIRVYRPGCGAENGK